MNDGDLIKWIRYLHAAAAVPKDDPDYEEAQAAVAHANRKIRAINRATNRNQGETPDALETARMAALDDAAGTVASAPVRPALAMLGGEGLATAAGPALEAFIAKIAGKAALDAKGVDQDAYERGAGAHPTAAFIGEMTPPVLAALAGRLGTKPGARMIADRLGPLPEAPPPRPIGFTTNEASMAGRTLASKTDPLTRLLALWRARMGGN